MPENPKKPESREVKLEMSPMMQALEPKPSDKRSFVFMEGYIGEVTSDYIQLFPTLDLRTYFKVPRGAIKLSEAVDPNKVSTKTRVVVDASAQIEIVKTGSQTFDAGYLAGAIAAANLPGAQPEPAQARGVAPAGPVVCLAACTPQVKQPGPVPHTTCASPCHTAPLLGS